LPILSVIFDDAWDACHGSKIEYAAESQDLNLYKWTGRMPAIVIDDVCVKVQWRCGSAACSQHTLTWHVATCGKSIDQAKSFC
jgi:hypothetical protein